MKYIFYILFLFIFKTSFCQKEGYNWYFGDYAAVSFNSGTAKSVNNSKMTAYSAGTATISTADGRLLFYTDGNQIFDSTHKALTTKLKGASGILQTALFVPRPDSFHSILVFSTKGAKVGGFSFSEIDTRLRSGLGEVISGRDNVELLKQSCGKLTAVRHANRRDYWVLTHQFNGDEIYAFLVTPLGVNDTPVVSKTGFTVTSSNAFNELSAMKLSPDGTKICSLNGYDSSIVADFDAATGKVSNAWGFIFGAKGFEFSAKSRYLYIPEGFDNAIYQYNLSSKTKSEFYNSRKIIDSAGFPNSVSLIQLGPDGKIYIPESNKKYLHALLDPDNFAEKVILRKNYVALTNGTSTGGLPDMVQSYFQKRSFLAKPNCTRDSVFFTISNTYDLDSAKWDFGDTASGKDNFSNKTVNVFHSYKTVGNYSAKLISYHKNYIDTIYETIAINYNKPYLGNDAVLCGTQKITLNPKGNFKSYKWSDGSQSKSLLVSKVGTFYVTVVDYDGCVSSDTIQIKRVTMSPNFSISDTSQCVNNNNFRCLETTKYTGDKRKNSYWYTANGPLLNDTLVNLNFSKSGTFTIKLISQSSLGCSDSITKTITLFPQTELKLSVNDSSQCAYSDNFIFTNSTYDNGKVNYKWLLDTLLLASGKNMTVAFNIKKSGNYQLRLTSETEHKCYDTLMKNIFVLESPKADFIYDLTCSRTPTNFVFTGIKLNTPITTQFRWNFNNQGTSNIENPSQLFGIGTKTVTLVLNSSNGCSDTMTKQLKINVQSKADFTVNDICETDSAFFQNLSQDATSYQWKFGDGNTSSLQNSKHRFFINGVTQTFNTTLVALVKDGCSDSISKAITVNENPISTFDYYQAGNQLELKATQVGNQIYHWVFDKMDSITTTNPSYTYTLKSNQKNICLTTTNLASCVSKTCRDIILGVTEKSKPIGINIYPNPNDGNFEIRIDKPETDLGIEIYNSLGELLKNVRTSTLENSFIINLDINKGVYFVIVKNGGEKLSLKVVVLDGKVNNR